MTFTIDRGPRMPLHPVHAVLLAGALPLFAGALLSDIAYAVGDQIQWLNFASWLIVGALLLSGFALLWAAIDLARADRRGGISLYVILLVSAWIVGLLNALTHARDAGASMPGGPILSVISTALIAAAVWTGFSTIRAGAAR